MSIRYLLNFILVLTFGLLFGCSSGSSGGSDDLDIAEIQEIEQTGEFSEDEFFSSDDLDVATEEEQLVEDVPGLEDDLNVEEGATGEGEALGGDMDMDMDVAMDEGSGDDLFEDAGFDDELMQEEGDIGQNMEVDDEDLDSLLSEDLESGDVTVGGGGDDVVATNDEFGDMGGAESESLELDSEEDLFRDIDEPVAEEEQTTDDLFADDTSSDVETETYGDDMMGSGGYADTAGSGMEDDMNQDVTVDEPMEDSFATEDTYAYEDDSLSTDTSSASELLGEDVSVDDVDYGTDMMATDSSQDTEKSWVPVKKMKTVPYTRSGVLVNAIYFVRQEDSLQSISDKIYGTGSSVDLTIVNPHLKPGNLKVGQKVYYNSPQRPQDNSRLLTYYEDVRAPASTYSASASENIREISEDLLGHPRSWMEVWATNLDIESKWALGSPYQIRYWKGGSFNAPSQPTMAQNSQPANNNSGSGFDEPSSSESSNSQANLDMGSNDELSGFESNEPSDSGFDDDLAMDDSANTFDEPDSTGFDDPALTEETEPDLAKGQNEFNGQGFNSEPPAEENLAGGDDFGNESFDESQPQEDLAQNDPQSPRNVAKNQGDGFQAQTSGGILQDPMKMGIIGGALLLLLLVGYMVRKRRTQTDDVVEMESFDFGGETVIDEEDNKTQIDI